MSYVGLFFAYMLMYFSFEIALSIRPAGHVVHRNILKVIAMGFVHGACVLIATVGPFLWLGSALPPVFLLWGVMITSVIWMTLCYWKPAVMAINRYHGVVVSKFIEV